MARSTQIIMALTFGVLHVSAAFAEFSPTTDAAYRAVDEANVLASDGTPIDPVIEEPFRLLFSESSHAFGADPVRRCGPLGPAPIGMGLLFSLAMGMRFTHRSERMASPSAGGTRDPKAASFCMHGTPGAKSALCADYGHARDADIAPHPGPAHLINTFSMEEKR